MRSKTEHHGFTRGWMSFTSSLRQQRWGRLLRSRWPLVPRVYPGESIKSVSISASGTARTPQFEKLPANDIEWVEKVITKLDENYRSIQTREPGFLWCAYSIIWVSCLCHILQDGRNIQSAL
jgi:hypothetical protein